MCLLLGPLCDPLSLLPWWAPYVGWGVVALLVLWALTLLQKIGGMPAVLAAVSALAYAFGYSRGRKGEDFNPLESNDPKDDPRPKPVTREASRKPRKQRTILEWWRDR